MEKRIGKREIILLVAAFAVLLLIWLGFRRLHAEQGSRIRITVSGETFGEYDLGRDQEIPIECAGKVTNTLVISDGKADMVSADCPDQTCVRMNPISAANESIVCLPNQIVVEVIASDEEAEFDVIAQ